MTQNALRLEDTKRASRPARRSVALGMLGLAAAVALGGPEAMARRSGAAEALTFRARETTSLEALEPRSSGAHWTQTVRRPVTDLVLRLRPSGGHSLEASLAAPGVGRPGQTKPLFEAELIIAAAGRIHVEDRAVCGPWQGDTIVCRTECDGGAFALRRRGSDDSNALTLLVGMVPSIPEAGFGDIVRLGACSDTQAAGGLAVKAGNAAEISLDQR